MPAAIIRFVPRYKLTIAYDGSGFHGWQKQDVPLDHPSAHHAIGPAFGDADDLRVPLRTVQHVVQQAVQQVVRQPVEVLGASRTDAGVHALAQCAAFSCSDEIPRAPDEKLVRAATIEPLVKLEHAPNEGCGRGKLS